MGTATLTNTPVLHRRLTNQPSLHSASMDLTIDRQGAIHRLHRALQPYDWLDSATVEEFASHKKDPKMKALDTLASNDLRHIIARPAENDSLQVSGYIHSEYKSIYYFVTVLLPREKGNIVATCCCKRAPSLCFHTVCLLYACILYRNHAMDPTRPKWLRLRGTKGWRDKWLEYAGIQSTWVGLLNHMVDEVPDGEKKLTQKVVPKPRGKKPKVKQDKIDTK